MFCIGLKLKDVAKYFRGVASAPPRHTLNEALQCVSMCTTESYFRQTMILDEKFSSKSLAYTSPFCWRLLEALLAGSLQIEQATKAFLEPSCNNFTHTLTSNSVVKGLIITIFPGKNWQIQFPSIFQSFCRA